ncbi:dynamin-related protein 4C isoform X2 [Selaginella moellendorffii]|uniref:dynamin-related protein 4C isoform X2 n=1 Tax=Selaginella moellendorffii TaxID=88036 RepID=UPI000D1C25AE|nr:dynamin-related protein 4C isoform X2 [Selaginella moellendorffii]|eukprot:XP_002965423.2 dynamin-related protein 4C isoform X2 [Selaginella moellendorffii]
MRRLGSAVSSALSNWESISSPIAPDRMAIMERYRSRRTPEECALQTPFNENVRPLLDAVDTLRQLSVAEEGIKLPTIVVVGDQSSGKSSVLESLAQVDLPRGQGVVTRVPLVLRLQNTSGTDQSHQVVIQYGGKKRVIEEAEISAAVVEATIELAGDKHIVNKPISLHITKPGAPDLTMIDLPGITRVPVHGQPEDIQEQIKKIIQEYISPKETIILNVICSTVDFPTCESILMSRQVDREGERTMAVVTKVDMSPKDLKEKVMADVVGIGLGYICVRNRIGDETHEEGRDKEAELFRTDPHLRDLPESMLGIRQLAKRLTEFQADSLRKNLPKLVGNIRSALTAVRRDLDALPQRVADSESALPLAMDCYQSIRRSLERLLAGDSLPEFPDDKQMNYAARLHEYFVKLSSQIRSNGDEDSSSSGSQGKLEELLHEAKGVTLPNILQSSVLKQMVAYNVKEFHEPSIATVDEVHNYAAQVVMPVISKKTEGYPKLQALLKKNMQGVLEKSQSACKEFVQDKLEKETTITFTLNPKYMELVEKKQLLAVSEMDSCELSKNRMYSKSSSSTMREMKNSLDSYMEVIKNRICDEVPMHLRYSLDKSLIEEFETVVMKSFASRDKSMELMAEDTHLQYKRERLQKKLEVLEESNRTILAATTI